MAFAGPFVTVALFSLCSVLAWSVFFFQFVSLLSSCLVCLSSVCVPPHPGASAVDTEWDTSGHTLGICGWPCPDWHKVERCREKLWDFDGVRELFGQRGKFPARREAGVTGKTFRPGNVFP